MPKLFFFYITVFIGLNINSQELSTLNYKQSISRDTTYLDEDGNSVTKDIFKAKLNSKYYFANIYTTDDFSVGKLQWSHYFGTLDEPLRNQFFKLLNKKYSIDTTKVIAIHYIDTLKSVDSYPKRDKIVNLDNGSHIHLISYKTFLKEYKTCLKNYKKNKQANVYHLYSHNEGHPEIVDKMIWHQDYQHKIKFLFNKNDKQSRALLIHPNGDYFIHYRYNGLYSNEILIQLQNNERWDIFITDFRNRTSALNSYKKHLVTVDN